MTMLTCIFTIGLTCSVGAMAAEDHSLLTVCKGECPSAKTESDAAKCVADMVKAKKSDKQFRKSDCYSAFKDHEKHANEGGHSH